MVFFATLAPVAIPVIPPPVEMAASLTREQEFAIPEATQKMPNNGDLKGLQLGTLKVLEIVADRQTYDEKRQVVTATGSVTVRFEQGVLLADRLEVNLKDRLAVAQGKVLLQRGAQILRGERFEYYFTDDRGVVIQARGELDQRSLGQDSNLDRPPKVNTAWQSLQPLGDRLNEEQPIANLTSLPGLETVLGGDQTVKNLDLPQSGGTVNRVRFEADRLTFVGKRWDADNIRLSNDPFSPPELQVQASSASYEYFNEENDRLSVYRTRLKFDEKLTLPLLPEIVVFLSRNQNRPNRLRIGVDGGERGGIYLGRSFRLVKNRTWEWSITPEYHLQEALFPSRQVDNQGRPIAGAGKVLDPALFGVGTEVKGRWGDRQTLKGTASLTTFDFSKFRERFRANVRWDVKLGDLKNPYLLSSSYNYRDRLFNGSLGFQTVQSSLGVVLQSPSFTIGKTGINGNYQLGIQSINAETDRPNLLPPQRDNNRASLWRYQGALTLGKTFPLWQGQTLPATRDLGLRYSPIPIRPYVSLVTGVTSVFSLYSSKDTQTSLSGSIGFEGQLGHQSRQTFDYTGFNLTYTQGIRDQASPFLFDRFADQRALNFGILQQVYGPWRLGFQMSRNLDTGKAISTDYLMEYTRRTYRIRLRYNPVLKLGAISVRISDFDWDGTSDPFETGEVRSVIQGVDW